MSGNRLVLDTNIILYLLKGDPTVTDFLEDKQGHISVITELELIGFPNIVEAELVRIKSFLSGCTIIEINEEVKMLYADLRKKYRLKLGDAMVAATAIFLDLPLMSADKGFEKVLELRLMNYQP